MNNLTEFRLAVEEELAKTSFYQIISSVEFLTETDTSGLQDATIELIDNLYMTSIKPEEAAKIISDAVVVAFNRIFLRLNPSAGETRH